MKKKLIITLAAVALIAVAAVILWWKLSPAEDEERGIQPAVITNIQSVVELSTIQIYEDLPVKGRIGKRHLVARLKVEGTISYDLEKIDLTEHGDTIVVTLPKETISLYESTLPNAYTVIDEWNDNPFASGRMSASDENAIKRRVLQNARNRIIAKGYVAQARAAARASLRALLAPTSRPLLIRFSPKKE